MPYAVAGRVSVVDVCFVDVRSRKRRDAGNRRHDAHGHELYDQTRRMSHVTRGRLFAHVHVDL